MADKTFAELTEMARQRHVALTQELKALERAFPALTEAPRDGRPGRRPGFALSPAQRRRLSEQMRAAWARRKAAATASHGPNGADVSHAPSADVPPVAV